MASGFKMGLCPDPCPGGTGPPTSLTVNAVADCFGGYPTVQIKRGATVLGTAAGAWAITIPSGVVQGETLTAVWTIDRTQDINGIPHNVPNLFGLPAVVTTSTDFVVPSTTPAAVGIAVPSWYRVDVSGQGCGVAVEGGTLALSGPPGSASTSTTVSQLGPQLRTWTDAAGAYSATYTAPACYNLDPGTASASVGAGNCNAAITATAPPKAGYVCMSGVQPPGAAIRKDWVLNTKFGPLPFSILSGSNSTSQAFALVGSGPDTVQRMTITGLCDGTEISPITADYEVRIDSGRFKVTKAVWGTTCTEAGCTKAGFSMTYKNIQFGTSSGYTQVSYCPPAGPYSLSLPDVAIGGGGGCPDAIVPIGETVTIAEV